jgi:hypothetical protein
LPHNNFDLANGCSILSSVLHSQLKFSRSDVIRGGGMNNASACEYTCLKFENAVKNSTGVGKKH